MHCQRSKNLAKPSANLPNAILEIFAAFFKNFKSSVSKGNDRKLKRKRNRIFRAISGAWPVDNSDLLRKSDGCEVAP